MVAALLGERLEHVLCGGNKRFDSAPLLLRLFEQEGANSAAMLERLENALLKFDATAPDGWEAWKRALPGADRATALSRYGELLLALTLDGWGYNIVAFEPVGAPGRLADLAVDIDGERVLIETSTPGPHTDDWIDKAMERLSLALSRVQSGLTVEIKGYEALRFTTSGEWEHDAKVAAQGVDDLINEFCRRAEDVDLGSLPRVVIAPEPGQPVTITVTAAGDGVSERTAVVSSWNRTGLVPNVSRLVEKILEERHHLPREEASFILIDLQLWSDFWDADFYLQRAAAELANRDLPAVVGTFIAETRELVRERRLLHLDAPWAQTTAGARFASDWLAT